MPQHRHPLDELLILVEIVACVALSTLLAYGSVLLDMPARYLAFLPSIALCCLLNGLRAGAMATALSALSLWYFLIPPDGFALPSRADAGHLLVFLVVAAILCWIIEIQRRLNNQLAQENFELGYKVSLLRTFRSWRESA